MFQPSDTGLIEKVSPFREHKIIRSLLNGSRGPMLRKATGLDWRATRPLPPRMLAATAAAAARG